MPRTGDPAALNRQVDAFVSTRLRPLSRTGIESFQTALVALPEVEAVYVVAGDEDFLVQVSVPSPDHLHAFLIDELSRRREVVSSRSQIVYQSARKQVLERLPRS